MPDGIHDRETVDAPPRSDSHPAEWIGRVIDDRYRVLDVLGEGGMGSVLAAEHIALRKHVAIKVILPRHAGDAELVARFARESLVTAKLEHPHVASAIDCGTLPEGGAYLVLQLARGRSLRVVMAERPGWRTALAIGKQIADVLAFAHAQDIVHRDLKPENVVVEERAGGALHAYVLDFGIARAPSTSTVLTRLGTVMGTPGYMAPEQAVGQPVDARADVYSLGVILWEITTGRALFEQTELAKLMEAQLLETAPLLSSIVPSVPDALDALVARMLDGAKANRPGGGAEVRDALRAIEGVDAVASTTTNATIDPWGGRTAPDASSPDVEDPIHARVATAAQTSRVAHTEPFVRASMPRTRAPRTSQAWIVGAAVGAVVLVGFAGVASWIAWSRLRAPADRFARVGITSPIVADPHATPERHADVATLVNGRDWSARRAAASRLDASRAPLEPYVRELVVLELAPDCGQRKQAVRRLRELRDPRALPALARTQSDPYPCGPSADPDCNHCLRRDLTKTIDRLTKRGRDDDD